MAYPATMSDSAPSRSAFPGFADMGQATADPVAIVNRLTDRRVALGLSQTEVAARMGTSQSAVARLEAGQTDARISTLQRYAQALQSELGFAVRSES